METLFITKLVATIGLGVFLGVGIATTVKIPERVGAIIVICMGAFLFGSTLLF